MKAASTGCAIQMPWKARCFSKPPWEVASTLLGCFAWVPPRDSLLVAGTVLENIQGSETEMSALNFLHTTLEVC